MFERGFKAWCERYSATIREQLGLGMHDPLDPSSLAAHLGIRVWTPNDVPGLSKKHKEILTRHDGHTRSCWSAVTLVANKKVLVILNSSHSLGRQASDLMHELAHRILDHDTQEIEVSSEGIMLVANYGKDQEDEADWLSAALLLPREALIWIKRHGLDDEEAARKYGVSIRMLRYRLSMTGVTRQFSNSKTKRRRAS